MNITSDGFVRMTAPAKLNLCLQVTGRRADGYHCLDSVVVFTDFGDSLTIGPTGDGKGDDSLTLSGPFGAAIETESENICLRTIRRFRDAGGVIGPLAVTLDKHIPVGAGLGGGSSNAAAMLRYLDRQAADGIAQGALAELALDLGADVPVCLAGAAQHMTGIGERLRRLAPAPQGHVVLARPDVSLSTVDVFREFAARQGGFNHQRDAVPPPADPHRIMRRGNDLVEAARHLCPEIERLMDRLAACRGAVAVQMSGSGSACFALFSDADPASAAATTLRQEGWWAVATSF